MTDSTYTHVFFLLDRSGSMQSIKSDTEGGFDAYIAELARGEGRCRVSLARFDNEYESVFHDIDVSQVRPLTLRPRGMTALLDSMGRLISDAGSWLASKPESERPDSVIVAIMTDGMENGSSEWTHAAIKRLVEQQEKQYAWTFMYMGADQDAIEVGMQLGIDPGRSLTYARGNVDAAFEALGDATNRYRRARSSGMDDAQAKAASAYSVEEREQADRGSR